MLLFLLCVTVHIRTLISISMLSFLLSLPSRSSFLPFLLVYSRNAASSLRCSLVREARMSGMASFPSPSLSSPPAKNPRLVQTFDTNQMHHHRIPKPWTSKDLNTKHQRSTAWSYWAPHLTNNTRKWYSLCPTKKPVVLGIFFLQYLSYILYFKREPCPLSNGMDNESDTKTTYYY